MWGDQQGGLPRTQASPQGRQVALLGLHSAPLLRRVGACVTDPPPHVEGVRGGVPEGEMEAVKVDTLEEATGVKERVPVVVMDRDL